MCSQQACSKLVNKVVTMLLFYQVATKLSLTTCWQVVEKQDDNKLLEKLVTSLLSSTTLQQVQTCNNLCVFTCVVCSTHVKTHELFQICKQVVTRLLLSRYQDVFALLVPSCCDKSETSCYHLVTRLMTVTDLLQVVLTRLIQTVRNKLLRACCHQLVNNLLRGDDIRLVGTTCCESVGLINLVARW
jgi:hypothetical protein